MKIIWIPLDRHVLIGGSLKEFDKDHSSIHQFITKMTLSTLYRQLAFGWSGFWNFTSKRPANTPLSYDRQSIDGRIMVITGANSGLGLETAKQWYLNGGVCYMICRSRERGEQAIKDITSTTAAANNNDQQKRLHLLVCDVSRPPEIVKLVNELRNSDLQSIDVLASCTYSFECL